MTFPISLSIALAAFLVAGASIEAQLPPEKTIELTPAETWIVAQTLKGEEADLGKQFPLEEQRKLSARFIEDALTGSLPGFTPHRRGMRISGAIIDDAIDLSNAQVSCALALAHCEFRRGVDLHRANFSAVVLFDGSVFKEGLNCNSMKCGQDAFFRNVVIEKRINFRWATITGSLMLIGSRFASAQETADFNSLKAEQNVFIDDCAFEGPVNFVGAQIGGTLQANSAHFNSLQAIPVFNSMRVGRSAIFTNAVFRGGVTFSYSQFDMLDFAGVKWPAEPRLFQFRGITYTSIKADVDELKSHQSLLRIAQQASYSADVYKNLEGFFSREGYADDANRAFIAGKRRERRENLHGINWLGSLLLDWLIGYGRHPERAGYLCLGVVALGCILFPFSKMGLQDPKELEKPEDMQSQYNRFWYSLGLFLPVVNLKTSDLWKPKKEYVLLRQYVRVHILLGWVLVPIFLAAISGLVK